MNIDRVSINVKSIEDTVKLLLEKCDIIEKSIISTRDKLDESKSYFDTPAATYFRQKVDDLLDEEILKLKNDFRPSLDVLNKIISVYNDEITAEKKILNGLKEN